MAMTTDSSAPIRAKKSTQTECTTVDGHRSFLTRIYRSLIRITGHNLGVSAIISDATPRRVLVLQSRLNHSWSFPGGAVRRGESIRDAISRECREELGADIDVLFLAGVYYVSQLDNHTCVFRCALRDGPIRLSLEHSRFSYADIETLPPGERIRALDALDYKGAVSMRAL